jgi:hypothetical protein
MEKNEVNILSDKTKDGVHIIMGIQIHKAIQVLLRSKILKELSDIWEDLPYINSIEDVIDLGVSKGNVPWQLYGSRKPGHKAYLLKNIYTIKYLLEDNDWTIEDNNINNFTIEKDFNKLLARNTKWPIFDFRENIKAEINNAFDVFNNKKTIKARKIIINKSNTCIGYDYSNIKNEIILDEYMVALFENINSSLEYQLKETHQFVMILPKSYYDIGSYNKWIRVGWALKNTDKRLFLTWLKFSSQSSEFNWSQVHELHDMWEHFEYNNPEGLTSRSIMFWAKNDSFEIYKKIRQETISYFIDETIKTCTEWDLANVLFQIYKDKFICASIKNNIWYEFDHQRWKEIDSGNTLRLLISKQMHDIYVKKTYETVNLMQRLEQTDPNYEIVKKKANKLSDLCLLLKKTNWKNNIMREARELFYDKDFINKLDQNSYLLCFSNYIIDFKHKIYRKGQPDDYISKSTNIDYIIELNNNDIEIKKNRAKKLNRNRDRDAKYFDYYDDSESESEFVYEYFAIYIMHSHVHNGMNHIQNHIRN